MNFKKQIYFFLLIFAFIFLIKTPVYAESGYVLPYPSAMPGSVWYKLDLLKEELGSILFFGDISQFKFNLSQSDKYLVEAKTLFEYRQYLLAYQALVKSDEFFEKSKPNLTLAKLHGKVISEKLTLLKSASEKHTEVLEKLRLEVPATFQWAPEKGQPTDLNLQKAIDRSIKIRKSVL